MSQQCSACHAQSPDGAKFCVECGSPLARACPSCGHPAAGGKFCGECGAPLSGAAPAPVPVAPPDAVPPSGPVSERRTTSVLFGDLVSFTTLSETRDPEEVRELLSAYFAVARTVVSRYGGTIEKFIGDAVMAVWGVPVAHEDDAERAVRAGLDLVSEVAALGASVGAPDLAMRVGVVTGSVAVTLGALNEGMVAGDAVNTAARVQAAAEPGTVWVDGETRGLTAAAVSFSDMGDHVLKGKTEPARLFRAEAVVAARGGAQRVDGLEAPMTGRDAEFRRLRESFHATEEDGRARAVVVEGLAGVGKSRLGWEFEKYVDGLTRWVAWHRGRCLSYGDGVAFWAFAEMVRSRLGLLESDDRDVVDEKVRTGVSAMAAGPAEAAWLIPRVAALLTGATGFERTDLFAAWTTFLERAGHDDPVVLLFEDVQHADSGLLDLIEHLLETSKARLFVVLMTRPELLEQRPSLAGGRKSTVISLTPLQDDAMRTLVDFLVADLPTRARTALVSRAEGIPLYAVETVRSLIDRDAVQARDGRYVFVDDDGSRVDLEQLAAPISLHTLIAARLDALSPVERRTVQDGSVLGLSFRRSGLMKLAEVSEAELDTTLTALVRKGVIQEQRDPKSPELGSYRFLQALVREVAYSTLARKDRRTRHLAAAAHLESDGGEASETLAGIIAQHLLDALDASNAGDPDRNEIAARARRLLTAAAKRSEALGSPAEALRSVAVALTLSPEPQERALLEELAARNALKSRELTRAEQLARDAAAHYRELGATEDALGVEVVLGRTMSLLGRKQEALDLAKEIDATLSSLPTASLELRVETAMLLSQCGRTLDPPTQRAGALAALALAEDLGEPGTLVRALNGLAITLVDVGSPTSYRAILDHAISLSRKNHLLTELGRSLANMTAEVYPHELVRAAELADEALAVNQQVGDAVYIETALVNGSFVWFLNGRWDRLMAEHAEWLDGREVSSGASAVLLAQAQVLRARGLPLPADEVPDSDDPYDHTCTQVLVALRHEAQGDVEVAADVAAAAVTAYAEEGLTEDFEMSWAPAVELQVAAHRADDAERLLQLAAPLVSGGRRRLLAEAHALRSHGLIAVMRGDDPEPMLRDAEEAFSRLGAPFYLARTRIELARWLRGQGRHGEAHVLLAEARPVLEELGAQPSLDELARLTSGELVG
jgi:class 3 adenylate cyclase/tetratricopeptide (TPR) repeat protein